MEGMLLIGLYFLPWIVALYRSHKNATPIGLVTLLTRWTGIGWVVALVWSATYQEA